MTVDTVSRRVEKKHKINVALFFSLSPLLSFDVEREG